MNFKKPYNLKIISILLAGAFLLNSTVYAIDLPRKSHLRPPSQFNEATEGFIASQHKKELPPRLDSETMAKMEVLYYPASLTDVATIKDFLDICPSLNEVVFVDPVYSPSIGPGPSVFVMPIERIREILELYGFTVLEEPVGRPIKDRENLGWKELDLEEPVGRYISEEAGIFTTYYKGRTVTFKLYPKDFYLCNPPEIEERPAIHMEKFPGSNAGLSWMLDFRLKLIEKIKKGDILFIQIASLPLQILDLDAAGLEELDLGSLGLNKAHDPGRMRGFRYDVGSGWRAYKRFKEYNHQELDSILQADEGLFCLMLASSHEEGFELYHSKTSYMTSQELVNIGSELIKQSIRHVPKDLLETIMLRLEEILGTLTYNAESIEKAAADIRTFFDEDHDSFAHEITREDDIYRRIFRNHRALQALIEERQILDLYDKNLPVEINGGHVRRVTRMAAVIAKEMECGNSSIAKLIRAALLHDIGRNGMDNDAFHAIKRLSDYGIETRKKGLPTSKDVIKRVEKDINTKLSKGEITEEEIKDLVIKIPGGGVKLQERIKDNLSILLDHAGRGVEVIETLKGKIRFPVTDDILTIVKYHSYPDKLPQDTHIEMRLLVGILIAADFLETLNNKDRIQAAEFKEWKRLSLFDDAEHYGTLPTMEKWSDRGRIIKPVYLAAERLIYEQNPDLLQLILEARQADSLLPDEIAHIMYRNKQGILENELARQQEIKTVTETGL